MGTQTVAVVEPEGEVRALALMDHAPREVLAAAQQAAVALRDVIARKPKPVMMNGEQYLENEDWQTLGRFYGITFKEDGDPEFVTFTDDAGETVRGFKASAVAVDKDGREITRATAYCLSDEEKWSTRAKYEWAYVLADGSHSVEDPGPGALVWVPNPNKPGKNMPKREKVRTGDERVPLFQLASMAQTRAGSKALRNVLSWVAVLAGYKPTPAEELDAQVDPPVATTTPATGPRRVEPVDAEVLPQARTAPPAGREPGSDDEPATEAPGKARIPPQGSKAWEDPSALGAEVLRLVGGDLKSARELLKAIAGSGTAKGMKGDAVRAAWLALAAHAEFGIRK